MKLRQLCVPYSVSIHDESNLTPYCKCKIVSIKELEVEVEDAFRFVTVPVQFRTGVRYAEREKGQTLRQTLYWRRWCTIAFGRFQAWAVALTALFRRPFPNGRRFGYNPLLLACSASHCHSTRTLELQQAAAVQITLG